jgi:hypothetical protein
LSVHAPDVCHALPHDDDRLNQLQVELIRLYRTVLADERVQHWIHILINDRGGTLE